MQEWTPQQQENRDFSFQVFECFIINSFKESVTLWGTQRAWEDSCYCVLRQTDYIKEKHDMEARRGTTRSN